MSAVESPVEVQSTVDFESEDELSNVPCWDGLNANDMEAYRCIVCHTLPFTSLLQCQNGHQICAGCYHIRVLDKMLGERLGTCPQCSVRIYRHEPYRNVDGELNLATVNVCCDLCQKSIQRGFLRYHKTTTCLKRWVQCKYRRIGCPWKGRYGADQRQHERNCEYRKKKGYQMLETLRAAQEKRDAKNCLFGKVMKLLQLPLITVRLLQKLPSIEGFPRNLWVTGNTFTAFAQSWSVQYKWQTPGSDPVSEEEQALLPCRFLFKLHMDSSDLFRGSLGLTYTLVSSVYTDVRFQPNLCEKCEFSQENLDGPPTVLYENSYLSIGILLNARGFYGRILMSHM